MTETVRATDTSGDLLDRLAVGGAGLLVATMDGLEDGSLARAAAGRGRLARPKITLDDARVDWTRRLRVDRQVRACTPEPGAWTTFAGERLRLGPVTAVAEEAAVRGGAWARQARVQVGTAGHAVGWATSAARQAAHGGRRVGAWHPDRAGDRFGMFRRATPASGGRAAAGRRGPSTDRTARGLHLMRAVAGAAPTRTWNSPKGVARQKRI